MEGLPAITAARQPHAARMAWGRGVDAIRQSRVADYLRGLTLARIGLVLLICTIFSVRQQTVCLTLSEYGCVLDADMLVDFSLAIARRFIFALPMLLAVTVADNLTVRTRQDVRILALSAAVLLGSIVFALGWFYTQPPIVHKAAVSRQWLFILTYSAQAILYGGLAATVLYLFVREREDAKALHATRLEKVTLDRQTIEARLQALQAQIEPHFLFNTLANIKLLYETGSSRAKPLIHDLGAYLRTALPLMRDARSTLSRELELAQSYMRVLKVRMGERLNVVVDVPADLRAATLPPMMLLTLVENAIKHGLGSLPNGGRIIIRAEHIAGRLRVSVIDDGIGFPKGFGTGVGLANTRARLAAMYAENGELSLVANPGGGVIARIELPLEVPSAEPAGA